MIKDSEEADPGGSCRSLSLHSSFTKRLICEGIKLALSVKAEEKNNTVILVIM